MINVLNSLSHLFRYVVKCRMWRKHNIVYFLVHYSLMEMLIIYTWSVKERKKLIFSCKKLA